MCQPQIILHSVINCVKRWSRAQEHQLDEIGHYSPIPLTRNVPLMLTNGLGISLFPAFNFICYIHNYIKDSPQNLKTTKRRNISIQSAAM